MLIPKDIADGEILVRFIFLDNFKNKKLSIDRVDSGEIFLDSRLVGVSLQRGNYCDENYCKKQAKSIQNKQYVGFVIFSKDSFRQTCLEYKQEREVFEAIIEFTPLDENGNYLVNRKSSTVNDKGNPSHSDIIYINPAMKLDESKPNTSLRLFSRKMFNKCHLILDDNIEIDDFLGKSFQSIIK